MQQKTTRLLYSYWNDVRNDRMAPYRFEIEPMKIAELLPETFIVECAGLQDYRFRLAGTRVCEHFGRELRGQGLLDLWQNADRQVMRGMLRRILVEAVVGTVQFDSLSDDGRRASFEMVVLPLIHTGKSVNRLMGGITAISPPSWLGSRALTRHAIIGLDVHAPDGGTQRIESIPHTDARPHATTAPTLVRKGERRFHVYDGGRHGSDT